MSRYLLLFLLNAPFILLAFASSVTQFKLKKISHRKLLLQIILYVTILTGFALAYPIYEWLFSNNLTQTEPLSLFDVVQITVIVILFYVVLRNKTRTDNLENRLSELHQELSIILSKD